MAWSFQIARLQATASYSLFRAVFVCLTHSLLWKSIVEQSAFSKVSDRTDSHGIHETRGVEFGIADPDLALH